MFNEFGSGYICWMFIISMCEILTPGMARFLSTVRVAPIVLFFKKLVDGTFVLCDKQARLFGILGNWLLMFRSNYFGQILVLLTCS